MRPEFPKVCVIGLGYIGLPTAALMAGRGLRVTGVDINPAIVDTVNDGRIHIVETDLENEVRKAVRSGHLKASSKPEAADIFIIAVPTPLSPDNKPVVDYVFAAAAALAPHLKRGDLVILESTSPVGTTEAVASLLAEHRPDLRIPAADGGRETADISIAYCPERVLPGRVLKELVENDRCIGGISSDCSAKARKFYELFVRGNCIETSARTAEMVKLTENAFRDVNIAFANELSLVCDRLDINVWELIDLANLHPRVQILKPGPGVGGHCIAVDPWFVVDSAPQEARLIRTAREVNDHKTHYVLEQVRSLIERHPEHKVCCLGLAFKANVDDLRESPALEIVEQLAEEFGERISVVEPFVEALPDGLAALGVSHWQLDEALTSDSILVLLVDHDLFRNVPQSQLTEKIVHDTRGIWTPAALSANTMPKRSGKLALPHGGRAGWQLQ